MQSEATMSQSSVDNKQIQYSLEQNDTWILSSPTLFFYGSEYLLSFDTEVPLSILPMVIYALAALALIALWYFLFWRPFDWIRVN